MPPARVDLSLSLSLSRRCSAWRPTGGTSSTRAAATTTSAACVRLRARACVRSCACVRVFVRVRACASVLPCVRSCQVRGCVRVDFACLRVHDISCAALFRARARTVVGACVRECVQGARLRAWFVRVYISCACARVCACVLFRVRARACARAIWCAHACVHSISCSRCSLRYYVAFDVIILYINILFIKCLYKFYIL